MASTSKFLAQTNKFPGRRRRHLRSVRPCVLQSGKGRTLPSICSALTCPGQHVSPCGRGLFLGSDEQIFGADEQVPRQQQRHLRSIRLDAMQQGGKGRILLRAVLPTCPGRQWLGLFPSLAATNKSLAQMSKTPEVAAALVQKMHSGRENSVRAMLVAACSAGCDGGGRSPEHFAH